MNDNRFLNAAAIHKALGFLPHPGLQHTAQGNIEVVEVPVVQKPVAVSQIPNNLGVVIKSEFLKDFDSLF
jgi:hypothetical protein